MIEIDGSEGEGGGQKAGLDYQMVGWKGKCEVHDLFTVEDITNARRQFPDVVVVVAGQREDEPVLAGLISDGLVYRFMHKPLSPRRAGMFLQAAARMFELTDQPYQLLGTLTQSLANQFAEDLLVARQHLQIFLTVGA